MSARNRRQFAESQILRAAVKAVMLAHAARYPLAGLQKASIIRAQLPPHLQHYSDSQIYEHRRAIQHEAIAGIDRKSSALSAVCAGAS